MITTRQELVQRIAEKLLQDDVLDINNFEDTTQLLKCVQNAIFDELRDFILINGQLID